MLIHNPFKETVVKYITNKLNQFSDSQYQSFIVIRVPGEYQEVNSKFNMVAKNIEYWNEKLKKFDNIKYSIEGYSMMNSLNSGNFDKKLHCKLVEKKMQYTDTLGRWVNIEDGIKNNKSN